ncbi:hypothetical protein [Paracoccus saliphilus]|uniref:Uncharacterized protein n=1 Tax=Paracoccus saliphilus TaxID=405559 RepID=A0AA46A4P9_9RHOB|nr:hypothetical protein [Paracoccus saliphilus]WCR02003.1 hypothetical protein JHX88_13915 [Paracoccus saliphilus]SIS66355.1 hypothetical protein SAMN05421772_102376 [Paracoccus saliphilus]
MNPLLISAACLIGAGAVALVCSALRLRWPLTALSLMLAVIALQLAQAARGQAGVHDLGAWLAMRSTVVPALLGIAAGIVIGKALGWRLQYHGWQAGVTAAALILSICAAGYTLLL